MERVFNACRAMPAMPRQPDPLAAQMAGPVVAVPALALEVLSFHYRERERVVGRKHWRHGTLFVCPLPGPTIEKILTFEEQSAWEWN